MKLNKMLALALSGVMAVSMLAGCSGAPSNGEEGDKEQPTTSNAVAVMNDAQDDVTFSSNPANDSALSAVVADAKTTDISGANSDYTAVQVKSTNKENQGAKLYTKLSVKLDTLSEDPTWNVFNQDLSVGKKTITNLYMVKADGLSEEQAVKIVAKAMNTDNYQDSKNVANGTDLEAEYEGSVSVEKVTKTNEAGDTYNAYLILVSVTQTVNETKATIA